MDTPTVLHKNFVRTFKTKEYKCKECNVTFIHRENYLIHYDVNHSEKKKTWCC